MALQVLEHTKRSGDKIYRYYSIAEAFWHEGKSKKRILANLGAISAEEVSKLKQVLRIHNNPNLQIVDPGSVTCIGSWDYLELAVFHELWEKVEIGSIIRPNHGDIELAKLLEILVLNRVCRPSSKLGVTRWYGKTALDQILRVPQGSVSESRLYRCLTPIEGHHTRMERHIFSTLIQTKTSAPLPLYFYDLSSSYFEGRGVTLGAFNENSKDHRPDRLQVVLGLLINERGIPFSWDIFKGNQGDAPTLIKQIKKFKKRFEVNRALLIFDRGFLSYDNLQAVRAAGYEFLTGLDSPQIETILELEGQKWLSEINIDTVDDAIKNQPGWKSLAESSYYFDAGIINSQKTILLFDSSRYKATVLDRQARLDDFKAWVQKHNEWLRNFKKDAERKAIQKDVDREVKKRGLTDYITYELYEYVTENKIFRRRRDNPYPSQGYYVKVRSLQIIVSERNQRRLDGVFALITSAESPLSAEEMALAYRQKYLIEMAFREMKSILKLRPWYVYTEDHIRAHYTICVLAYLLERLLDLTLEESECKSDGWTLQRLREELEKYRIVEIQIPSLNSNTRVQKLLQSIPHELQQVLKRLKVESALKVPVSNGTGTE